MSSLRPLIDESASAALDGLDLPVTVTTAVRDRDGRLLDFRLEHVNLAAAAWAGLGRDALLGRLATDLIPGLRPSGLFDALDRVVATGQPFRQVGQRYEGMVEEGRPFAAVFDLLAVRHGDGYVSAWAEQREGDGSAVDIEVIVERARAAVRLIRLEASPTALRLRPAT